MNGGQQALQELRRERAEQRDAQLRKVKEIKSVDEYISEVPGGAVIPEKVAMRMGKRMLPFVGIPLIGGMGSFVTFWYFATYRDLEFQPSLVAFTTIAILALGLVVSSVVREYYIVWNVECNDETTRLMEISLIHHLSLIHFIPLPHSFNTITVQGITYSVMSASWDEDVEGSLFGFEEFGNNLNSLKSGLSRSRDNLVVREQMAGMSEAEIQAAIRDLDKRERPKSTIAKELHDLEDNQWKE